MQTGKMEATISSRAGSRENRGRISASQGLVITVLEVSWSRVYGRVSCVQVFRDQMTVSVSGFFHP